MAVVTGTEGNDSLVGSGDNDTIYGLAGDDQLYGAGRDDELTGGPGADLLDGGPGGRDSANYDTDTATQGVIIDFRMEQVMAARHKVTGLLASKWLKEVRSTIP